MCHISPFYPWGQYWDLERLRQRVEELEREAEKERLRRRLRDLERQSGQFPPVIPSCPFITRPVCPTPVYPYGVDQIIPLIKQKR